MLGRSSTFHVKDVEEMIIINVVSCAKIVAKVADKDTMFLFNDLSFKFI